MKAFTVKQIIFDHHQRHAYMVAATPETGHVDDSGEPAYLLTHGAERVSVTPDVIQAGNRFTPVDEEIVLEVKHKIPAFELGVAVLHKHGGKYLIVGLPEYNTLEHDRSDSYAYLMPDGRVCHRKREEFEDGRFVLCEPEVWMLTGLTDLMQAHSTAFKKLRMKFTIDARKVPQ